MNTKRVAKLYFRQMRLPFLICFAVATLFAVGIRLAYAYVGELLFSPTLLLGAAFFFIFILWNGKAFDDLFLQFSASRRAQVCGFFVFLLPAALLGALCNALLSAGMTAMQCHADAALDLPVSFADTFQFTAMYRTLFVGSVGKVIFFTVLFQTVNSMRWMVLARMIVSLRRMLNAGIRVIGAVLTAFVLFLFLFLDLIASNNPSLYPGELPYTFLFGGLSASSILLARLATMGICAGVLVLCTCNNRKNINGGKRKSIGRHRNSLALAGIALSVAVGVFSVCFCTPAVVNLLEYVDTESEAPTKTDATEDMENYFAESPSAFQPNETAYRLLQMQDKIAVGTYRRDLAEHIVYQYYSPENEVLPYTDYETGKRYYEYALNAPCGEHPIYRYGFGSKDGWSIYPLTMQMLYFQYLYQNGGKDEAYAFWDSQLESDKPFNLYIASFPVQIFQTGSEADALQAERYILRNVCATERLTEDKECGRQLDFLKNIVNTSSCAAAYDAMYQDIIHLYAPPVKVRLESIVENGPKIPRYYTEDVYTTEEDIRQYDAEIRADAHETLENLEWLCEQAQKPYPGI